MLLIVTEYEPLLEQIGKEIEQGEGQTGAIPTRGTHPHTPTDQDSTHPLKLKKPNVFYYRIIKALIETGCFEETTNDNIVNRFCSIVTGKDGNLTNESFRSQTVRDHRKNYERDILEVINSLCKTLHKFGENYEIQNGEIQKKPY